MSFDFKFSSLRTLIFQKKNLWQRFFDLSLFFLLFGFVNGNLFGTFLQFLRQYFIWDGLIIMFTLLIIEAINLTYFVCRPKPWVRLLNFYKMGLLLGFFTDAFKVGS